MYSSTSSSIRYEYSLYVLQSRHSRSRCGIPGTRYMQAPNRLQIRGMGVCLARKTPYEQGLPHSTCYKQSNAFLMRRRRRSTVSPWNVDLFRSTTLRVIRSASSGLGQRSFRSSALNRKSCHASVSVMLENRCGCCRADEPIRALILPDTAHDSRNQGRVVSLSALSLLSACVRLRQLREVHHSLQRALNAWSRTQSAATDGS